MNTIPDGKQIAGFPCLSKTGRSFEPIWEGGLGLTATWEGILGLGRRSEGELAFGALLGELELLRKI